MSRKRAVLYISLLIYYLMGSAGCSGSARSAVLTKPETGLKTESKSHTSESPYFHIDSIENGKIIHLPTGLEITEERLIDTLSTARIIYVGEVHDSLEDHGVQLKILRGLFERFPGQVAVGMEMFRHPSQPKLDRWTAGEMDDKTFLKLWHQDWGGDYGYYEALLNYIGEKKIPLIALKPSQEMEVKIGMMGIEGLSENDRKKLPEIDRNDPYHTQALKAIFKGHGPGSDRFASFHETMLLWDESMAENLVRYLSSPEGADKKILVFAGGFHVGYGFGIPRRVYRRLPVPYRIVMPHSNDFPNEKKMLNVKTPDLPLPFSDYIWGVPYRELQEKKIRLGVFIERFQAGIRISKVMPDSPAQQAGLAPGDIVMSFDGQTMTDPFDLTYAVQQQKPGATVKIVVIRKGKQIETEAVLKVSGHP
ncbi:MAG: ChaN family lipoprotein [Nitrospiria bacterium]